MRCRFDVPQITDEWVFRDDLMKESDVMLEILDKMEFEQVYNILEKSFPEDERRPFSEQLSMLDIEKYRIWVYKDKGQTAGFIAVWDLQNILFVEHLAVSQNFRNGGLGSRILREFAEMTDKQICLEVEPPETDIAKRRIEFYRRNGFYFNDYEYFQPPISKGKKALKLFIMTSGRAVSREEFTEIRDSIYRNVYETEEHISEQ